MPAVRGAAQPRRKLLAVVRRRGGRVSAAPPGQAPAVYARWLRSRMANPQVEGRWESLADAERQFWRELEPLDFAAHHAAQQSQPAPSREARGYRDALEQAQRHLSRFGLDAERRIRLALDAITAGLVGTPADDGRQQDGAAPE